MKPHKRKQIAAETMEIYAPLAGRMGIQEIKDELSDLVVSVAQSGRLQDGRLRLHISAPAQRRADRGYPQRNWRNGSPPRVSRPRSWTGKEAVFHLAQDGKQADFPGAAFGYLWLPRHHRRMPECYRTLGCIHTKWPVVPGPLQGLHLHPEAERLSVAPHHDRWPAPPARRVQIRTRWMHHVAEYGVAAHSLYKDGPAKPTAMPAAA